MLVATLAGGGRNQLSVRLSQIISNPTRAAELARIPKDLQLHILGEFRGLAQAPGPAAIGRPRLRSLSLGAVVDQRRREDTKLCGRGLCAQSSRAGLPAK